MPATGDPTLRLRISRNRDNGFRKRSMPATAHPTRINERAYEHDVLYMSHGPGARIKPNSDHSVDERCTRDTRAAGTYCLARKTESLESVSAPSPPEVPYLPAIVRHRCATA